MCVLPSVCKNVYVCVREGTAIADARGWEEWGRVPNLRVTKRKTRLKLLKNHRKNSTSTHFMHFLVVSHSVSQKLSAFARGHWTKKINKKSHSTFHAFSIKTTSNKSNTVNENSGNEIEQVEVFWRSFIGITQVHTRGKQNESVWVGSSTQISKFSLRDNRTVPFHHSLQI
jgi:hypothetical protein